MYFLYTQNYTKQKDITVPDVSFARFRAQSERHTGRWVWKVGKVTHHGYSCLYRDTLYTSSCCYFNFTEYPLSVSLSHKHNSSECLDVCVCV